MLLYFVIFAVCFLLYGLHFLCIQSCQNIQNIKNITKTVKKQKKTENTKKTTRNNKKWIQNTDNSQQQKTLCEIHIYFCRKYQQKYTQKSTYYKYYNIVVKYLPKLLCTIKHYTKQ